MEKKTGQHPMAVVTRRTGLRADVIRSWERRHGAVEPSRSAGNHRLYTDEDIERLLLIRQALDAGWQIGQVAALADEEIGRLLQDVGPEPPRPDGFETVLRRCLSCIEQLDGSGLQRELEAATVELGRIQVLESLVAPLLDRIGEACQEGRLRIAHEHLASAAIRSFLGSMRGAYPAAESGPAVVVTTPATQHHELAALLVAAVASSEGWRTIYLGPNLPAEEIAAAVGEPGVRVLALSVSFDAHDDGVDEELRKIGRLVPKHVRIIVGGRASGGYRGALEEMGADRIVDLRTFRHFLNRQRGER